MIEIPEEKIKIMIVDDESILRAHYEGTLMMGGYDVKGFRDGKKAIKSIESGLKYDLLISNLSLQDIGGEEVIKTSKKVNPGVPVISISGDTLERYESRKGCKVYSDEHILKPVTEDDELLGPVRSYLPDKPDSGK